MARVLTGIQSSGVPHLGNILGAIIPGIEMSKNSEHEALFFIANLHAYTSIKEPEVVKNNTYSVAATWISFGFDYKKGYFYRQSDIPEVCELAWYLNCFTPYPMLANAHSFKDKSQNLSDVNSGLFTYPVLMAADILLYDANLVPVGKDQIQHLEITRDIAQLFNRKYGDVFVIPEAKIDNKVMIIPGIDGRKMSKSYHNYIDIFLPEKELKKQVMKIVTASTPLEEPKDYKNCTVFNIYSCIANASDVEEMKNNYLKGGYGFGHAKQALFELLWTSFSNERKMYHELIKDTVLLENILSEGAIRAKQVAMPVLNKVRGALGLKAH